MYADSSTADGIPNDPSTAVVVSGEAKPAAKMVHCETCGFSLNSETQAAAHYSGKSHLKRLKQLKHGNQVPTFRPYKPKPAAAAAAISWSTQTQTMTRWGTQLQQPRKTSFNPVQTNFRFGGPNPSVQSFEQNQTISSLGYSFNSFQSTTSSGNNYLPSTRGFDQSTGPFGQAVNNTPVQQTNQNPVTKAVMENFLGILPTKRRKIVNCHVCGLVFNSDSQADAHFRGAKHQRKVQLTSGAPVPANDDESKNLNAAEKPQPPSATLLRCDTCHVSVNSQKQLAAHYQGMNHKSKLGLIEGGKTETQPSFEVQEGQKGGWFFCATCNISVPTSAALSQHVLSAEHNSKKPVEGL